MMRVVTAFAVVGTFTEVLVSGELAASAQRRRMDRRIERLRGHYVVCAFGRVGRTTVQELRGRDHEVLVIEPDPAKVPLLEAAGVPYLTGDPTAEAVLRRAGVDRARGLVCAVDSDASNAFITLTARSLNPLLTIVARASQPESVDKLERAGADKVVSPYTFSGRRMALLAVHPAVVDVIDVVGLDPHVQLEQVVVQDGSPLAGVRVGEAQAGHPGVAILAIRRAGADHVTSPEPDLALSPGDLVVVLGPERTLGDLAG